MAKPLGLSMEDPNIGVLTAQQQPAPDKFRISLVAKFEPKTMCLLLGPYFLVFALTNWATLVGNSMFTTFKFQILTEMSQE